MALPPNFLDELRARTPLPALIGRKTRVTKSGRQWKACCPFHGEKTPSFYIYDDHFHCFGCGAHGDAIRFLTDSRGLPFMDAVKELAAGAGMEVPAPDPRSRERAERQATLHDVMAAAQAWFAEQLDGIDGAEARAYCQRRGIGAGAIKRFGIGFAPDRRQGLRKALAAHGDEKLIEGGLLIHVEEKEPYDRFRGRLMIPIRDARGRCIAFGGRSLDPNARAKYLNSPETPLFDKGRNLYNLGPARSAVAKGQPLVVAEGYMDVIALVRAGVEGAVAPLGTAITEEQLRLMWRVAPEPVIALDGDAAGLRAAMRLIDMALPLAGPGQALRFALLPSGQDPDDLIRAGGAGAIRAVLDQAQPLVDLLWRRETEGRVFDSPERRAALDKALDRAEQIARTLRLDDGDLSAAGHGGIVPGQDAAPSPPAGTDPMLG